MADKVAEQDVSTEIADVKPQRHNKYCCLKAYVYVVRIESLQLFTTGRTTSRVLADLFFFHIVSQGVYVHDEHNSSDSARAFTRRQEQIASE